MWGSLWVPWNSSCYSRSEFYTLTGNKISEKSLLIIRNTMIVSSRLSTMSCCLLLLSSCSVMSDTFATQWIAAHKAPLSMKFSRQEYWSGLPFPSPGDLPDPWIKPMSPALASGCFYQRTTREAEVQ